MVFNGTFVRKIESNISLLAGNGETENSGEAHSIIIIQK